MSTRKDPRALWDARYASARGALPGETPWVAAYHALLEEKRDQPMLDLGCGRGDISLYLKAQGYSVTACDLSQVALDELAERDPSLPTLCFDMTEGLPAQLSDPGVIVASLSTHYFALDETRRLYTTLRERLAEGGLLLVRVNSLDELERNDRPHVVRKIEEDHFELADGSMKRYFSEETLAALLQGMEVLTLRRQSFFYHANEKYALEAVARRLP